MIEEGDIILSANRSEEGFSPFRPLPVSARVVGVTAYAGIVGRAIAGTPTPHADALAALAAHLIAEDNGAAAPEGSAVAALIEEFR